MKRLFLVVALFTIPAFAETVSVGSLPIGRQLFTSIASTVIEPQ